MCFAVNFDVARSSPKENLFSAWRKSNDRIIRNNDNNDRKTTAGLRRALQSIYHSPNGQACQRQFMRKRAGLVNLW